MDDLIKTIEDNEIIKIEDEESESDEELTVATTKQRNQRKSEKKGFSTDFQFEDEGFYETSWSLDSALHQAMKKKNLQTTLDQKIEHVRRQRLNAKKIVQVSSNEPGGQLQDENESQNSDADDFDEVDDDDVLVESDAKKIDTLRIKMERKRKLHLKKSNQDEDDNDDFVIPLAKVTDSIEGNKTSQWDPKLTFQGMNLSRPILRAISEMNYVTPTPIQQAAIPIGLMGRDICACAATGTGKTAAFMLPILERLLYGAVSNPVIRVLCLVPTRELAVQVFSVTQHLAQHSSIRVCLAAGGLEIKSQEASLRNNPDIVIATPGRLIDHLHNTPSFVLDTIEVLILDEADRMLQECFEDQMAEIIKLCSKERQTMLFSATLNDKVQELATLSLTNPVKIFINTNTDVAPFLRQEFIRIRESKEADREAIVLALCCRSFISNVLMFTQTKKQAHRLHIVFGLLGLKAGELHGNLSQQQRLENLKRFRDGETDVLICTDLAARGLDIENVKTVINFTMPNSHQHYVHRVGRTARAGRSGRSISLVGESERNLLKEIVKASKNPVKSRTIPIEVIKKFSEKLKEVEKEVGEVLKMEAHEKEIIQMENQVKKGLRIVTGKVIENKKWFQSTKEREKLRSERNLDSFTQIKLGKGRKKRQGKEKASAYSPEERVKWELEKTKQYQKRMQRRAKMQPRLRVCPDSPPPTKKPRQKKRQSNFDVELANVSKRAVVAYRNLPNAKTRKPKRPR